VRTLRLIGSNTSKERATINLHRRAQMQRRHRDVIASVCGWCHQWMSEEDRLAASNGATVTHGICPECASKHFPDPPKAA